MTRVLAAAGACAALAALPATAAATVSWSSFTLVPTTLQAGGATNYTVTNKFTNSSDTVKDLTTVQAPGLYAAPLNVGGVCTPAQLSGGTCPATTQIGTATISAVALGFITQTLSGKLYNMAAQSSAEVGRIGLYAPASGLASATSSQTSVVLRSSPTVGLNLITNNVPNKNGSLSITVTSITETVNGTVNGKPFVRMPTSCVAASSTGVLDSYSVATPVTSAASSFTPTGCTSGTTPLKYTPSLSASVTPDSGDSNVAATITVKQNATDAASKSVAVTLPGALAPNLATLGQANANGCTQSALANCLVVGTVSGSTSLLSTQATGNVYLVGRGAGNLPGLTIAMNAPFQALQFNASLAMGANNTLVASFGGLPDLPLTNLAISLNGGANSLLQEGATIGCASSISGAFTAQDAATASASAPITVNGSVPACPPAQSYPNGSTGSATTAGFTQGFQLSPSSTAASTAAAAASPNLTANLSFSYANGTDSLKDEKVALGSGILASPSAVTAYCTSAQLSANACPAASQVGQGTVVANTSGAAGAISGAQTLVARQYLLAAQSSSEFAEVGVVVSLGTTALFTTVAPATLDSAGHVTLTFSNIPNSVTLFPSSPVPVQAQLKSMSLTFNGTVDGNPFTFAPAQCVAAASAATGDTYAGSDTTATSSSFTPSGCPANSNPPLPATGTASDAQGTASSFNVTPSTTAVNANPNVSSTLTFQYLDSNPSATNPTTGNTGPQNCADLLAQDTTGTFRCDALANVTVNLAQGLIANPEQVAALCTSAQLSSNSCPAGSQIANGGTYAYTYDENQDDAWGQQNNLATKVFLMPAASPSKLADVGLVVYLSGNPVTTVEGTAALNGHGQVQLSFANLPTHAALGTGGADVYVQVSKIALTFAGTVGGNPFTINPSGCTQATSSASSTTVKDTAPLVAQSTFVPTGC